MQLQHRLVVHALHYLHAHEVDYLEVALLAVDEVFLQGLLVELVVEDVSEALLDVVADGGLGLESMAELEREDGFALCAEGTQTVDDVVEDIVEAVIEGEVRGQVLLVPQHLCLELVDLLQTEEGDLYFVLSLYLVTHLLFVLFCRAAHISQDLQWFALVVI